MPKSLFFTDSDPEIQSIYSKKKQKIEEKLLGESSEEEKILVIKEQKQLFFILELANENEHIRNLCLNKELELFWSELFTDLKKFREYAQWPLTKFAFKLQPLIPVFDQVCGLFFYSKNKREKKFNEKQGSKFQSNDLQNAALKYHFFPALEELINIKKIRKALKENPNAELLQEIKSKIDQVEKEAAFHGTPAHLLCAHLRICAARYYRHYALDDPFKTSSAYGQALISYEFAEKTKKNSEAAIYNAYRGEGIAATNREAYEDIVALQAACIKVAGKFLHPAQIKAGKALLETFFAAVSQEELPKDETKQLK